METTAEALTPVQIAALCSQAALFLGGLTILWTLRSTFRGSAVPVRLARWGISPFEFAFAAFVVLTGGFVGQLALGAVIRPGAINPDIELVWAGAAFQAGLLLGLLVAWRQLRRSPTAAESEPAVHAPSPPKFLAGLATFVAALPILFLVNWPWIQLLQWWGFDTGKQPLVDLFARVESPWLIALIVFLAVIVAPVVEETVFRAGLFRFLRTRVPRAVALGLPAVTFGALHGNLVAFAPLAVLGVIFSLAYERTGSIAVPMIAHGFFNLNTLLLLLAGVTG